MSANPNRAREIFLAALQMTPDEWEAYLNEVCGDDQKLRTRVLSLLDAHREADSFLEPVAPGLPAVAQEPVAEAAGTMIGPYRLLEQIGEGGFGVVFMAEQQQPVRRKVALKVLKPGMDTKQVVARFEAERQALALMDHPHIAQVHDAGTSETGRPYFVMQLIRGIPITAFCDENQLTPRERLELFITVCQAVQHAHQKGIIHRDLKPSNVLVTLLDGTPTVKVIDFGIAKALGQERLTDKTLFTGFAHMIGTPLYMSPEQAEMSGQDVDTRTDIYSLGVLLYELLTGTTPFDRERLKGASYDEIRRIIREEEPVKPSTRISTLGQAATTVSANRKSEPKRLSQLFRGELDWIVMKALEKDRNRRYETASSFSADVQRYLDDEPVQACPPSAGYRLRKFARKNRRLVSVAVVCVLAAFFGAGNLLWWAQKRAETAGRAEESLRRAGDLQTQGKWAEALEAAQNAEDLLQLGGGSTHLKQRVQESLKDLKMIRRLEDIRLEAVAVGGQDFDNSPDVSYLYADAFRNYGVDVHSLETEEAAQQIRDRSIRVELAAALDHWAHSRLRNMPRTGDERIWKHLIQVAQATDPDPWRIRLRSVLEKSPMDPKILQELAASTELASQPALSLDLLGNYLAEARRFEQAEIVLRQAQRWHPDNFWINADLAACLNWRDKRAEAVAFRRLVVALRPQSVQAHYSLGRALLKQGDLEQAIDAFNEAFRFLSDDASIIIGWDTALQMKSAFERAVVAFQKASRLQPDEAGIYINWGSVLKDHAALEQAVAVYDKALATLKKVRASPRQPASSRALLHLAAQGRVEALFVLGRFEEAQQTYQEALGLDASDPWNWYSDAPLRLYLGDVEGYRRDCREMLARFGPTDDPKIADCIARTCLLAPDAVGNLAPLLQLAERAVSGTQHHRGYSNFLLSKGMADYRAGDFAHAIDRLNQTLSLQGKLWDLSDPYREATAHVFLAMAHQRLGHTDQARQALDEARRGAPDRTRSLGPTLNGWLRFRIVLPEAERLVKGKTGERHGVRVPVRAQPGFQAPLSFETGRVPVCVAVGDFNGDGHLDLAVANQADDSVSVLLSRQDGTFQPAVDHAAGSDPSCVVVADFNGDGKLDLAVANYCSNDVSVLLGNGDGTFQKASDYRADSCPLSLAVGDFNGDGVCDLAVANQLAGTVSVLLGKGDGTFQAAVNYNCGHSPYSVAVGDFNGDGIPDLVVANHLGQGTVSVLLGNGDGTFQAAQSYAAGNGPSSVAVGDFNRDGHLDLVVALHNVNVSGTTVGILLGNGDGTFQAIRTYPVGIRPWFVAVGDLNGDGILDLAVTSRGSVRVLLGNGDGTFQAAQGYPVGWSYYNNNLSPAQNSLAIGDLNGDGKPDLAMVNSSANNVSVLLGKGDGTFPAAPNYSAGSHPAGSVAVADFNGDGILDLAVTNLGGIGGDFPGTLSILLGKGDGTFQPAVNYPTGPGTCDVVVADFNGDGIPDLAVSVTGNGTPDLAVSTTGNGTLGIFLGKGDGTFQPAVYYPAGKRPRCLVVADFNGDGILDLAVTNIFWTMSSVSVLLGNGDGSFQAPQSFPVGINPYSMVVGDFNGDGVPDLAVANVRSDTVSILLGKGDGTFQAAGNYATPYPEYIVVGDFNGDGKLDLAVANAIDSGTSGSVSVLLGNGDGSFQAPVRYPTGPFPYCTSPGSMAVGDVNGDGVPDLVAAFLGGVLVLLGNGDGTFQTTPISYLAGLRQLTVAIGDFNGDGRPDVAVANLSPNGGVSILINNGKWAP
jgi:serine/threonine protein kinase/Flp pilus assembly protein TadD